MPKIPEAEAFLMLVAQASVGMLFCWTPQKSKPHRLKPVLLKTRPFRPRAGIDSNGSILPCIHKCARIFHRRLLKNSVSKIQDMSDAARFLDSIASCPTHALLGPEQNA